MSMSEEMNWMDHLEELRKRLIVLALAITAGALLCFYFSDALVEWITVPVKQHLYSLYFLSPYEAFLTKIKVSIVAGIILVSPVIFTQLWRFVSPGLYQKEKKVLLLLVSVSTVLFFLGILSAYYLTIPFALKFFLDFQTPTLIPLISIGSYLAFFLSLILAFGVMFNLPVVLIGLIWVGALGTPFLACQRKVAIVLIFILAAVLTPTADIFTLCLLALPLWLLFEASIIVGRIVEGRRKPAPS